MFRLMASGEAVQFHAHLPHPDCKRLAVFTLSTTAVGRREQYRAILRHIAALATFESPLAPSVTGVVMSDTVRRASLAD